MSETLILSVDMDPAILLAREEILQADGYVVVSVASIKEAFQQFRDSDYDLMILGETLPTRDRERLTCLIRASGSRMPIVSITSSPWGKDVFPEAALPENPAELLKGIQRLLAKRFELAAIGSPAAARSGRLRVGAGVASQL